MKIKRNQLNHFEHLFLKLIGFGFNVNVLLASYFACNKNAWNRELCLKLLLNSTYTFV